MWPPVRFLAVLWLGAAAGCAGAAGRPAHPLASPTQAAPAGTVPPTTGTTTSPLTTGSAPAGSPTTVAATTTTPAPPPALPAPAAATAACADGQLRVGTAPVSPGLSHYGLLLVFTNIGRSSCTVTGYPGADGLSGARAAAIPRMMRGYLGGVSGRRPVIGLAPGAAATALLEGNSACVTGDAPHMFTALRVTPPGSHLTTQLNFRLADCQGIAVHPVVPGPTGNYPSR